MICAPCKVNRHSICANTHRKVAEVELAERVPTFVPFGADLFIERDVPATTWCDCQHQPPGTLVKS